MKYRYKALAGLIIMICSLGILYILQMEFALFRSILGLALLAAIFLTLYWLRKMGEKKGEKKGNGKGVRNQ